MSLSGGVCNATKNEVIWRVVSPCIALRWGLLTLEPMVCMRGTWRSRYRYEVSVIMIMILSVGL